jgi:hypothetical protein
MNTPDADRALKHSLRSQAVALKYATTSSGTDTSAWGSIGVHLMKSSIGPPFNGIRFMRALSLLIATALNVACSELANAAGPNFNYFDFSPNGANTYIANAGGVLADMTFSTPGDDTLFLNPVTASASQFVTQFGATVPGFNLTNGAGGSAGDGLAQMTFSAPLPNGSRLLVLDLDVPRSQERVEIAHTNGVVTFNEQLESEAGEMSLFPVWNPATGVLLSQGPSNNEECTVFDVSGVSALSVHYLRTDFSQGGQTGAHIALGVPVPEPCTGGSLIISLVLTFSIHRRRMQKI